MKEKPNRLEISILKKLREIFDKKENKSIVVLGIQGIRKDGTICGRLYTRKKINILLNNGNR